jgi:hypothetical protein
MLVEEFSMYDQDLKLTFGICMTEFKVTCLKQIILNKHGTIHSSLDCHHRCVSKLLMHLKKKQSFTETFITRHHAGIREPKKT